MALRRGAHDCVVVGAGPAGLVAAMLLARSRRDVVLLDAGRSRARWIPRTRNCPGYPSGITGPGLLQRLRRQLQRHDVVPLRASAQALRQAGDGFVVESDAGEFRARTVVAATGVVDVVPDWPGIDDAIRRGVVRLCAICDGYELYGRRVAVFGTAGDCVTHACYLRKHSPHVTAIHPRGKRCSDEHLALAKDTGVNMLEAGEGDCELHEEHVQIRGGGRAQRFDAVYVSLGSRARTGWLEGLGLDLSANGEIPVDDRCQTAIPGLYAIGDVVDVLNQIAVAWGHASLAASAIDRCLPRNPCTGRRISARG